ncbi:histidine phosphatase family protein [Aquimarina agarilytica]|uniref:histidine phosphatase family protein n=1 Tax=Aquimarina agarilytica TaxID=1087449 RepID=UPI000289FF7A|nr:histidine phosphatase family protein [Aquimarina agarilytica]
MEIYLVRHTTPKIDKGICYGQLNLDVTDSFVDEVALIKKQLPVKEAELYSSPLLRCYKLACQLGNPISLRSELKELNFGTWENIPWNAIPSSEIDPWMANFVTEKPPCGESYLELNKRVLTFFDKLTKIPTETPIIIVSHAGPMRAFLASVLDIPLKDSFSIKLDYGQVIRLTYINNKFTVTAGLETPIAF